MIAKDAEQILAHLQRAEIELNFAAADLGSQGALAHYPEVEIALMALGAAVAKLSAAIAEADLERNATATPKAN